MCPLDTQIKRSGLRISHSKVFSSVHWRGTFKIYLYLSLPIFQSDSDKDIYPHFQFFISKWSHSKQFSYEKSKKISVFSEKYQIKVFKGPVVNLRWYGRYMIESKSLLFKRIVFKCLIWFIYFSKFDVKGPMLDRNIESALNISIPEQNKPSFNQSQRYQRHSIHSNKVKYSVEGGWKKVLWS